MNRVKVWAHRGASGYAPENTMEAFQMAIDMGADGIELDLQLSKDGIPIVIHDETLNRLCGINGWVKDYTLEELKSFQVMSKFPEYRGTVIPTLEEVYNLLKNSGVTINVEIKNGIIFYENIEEKALKLAQSKGMEDQVVYSSFNHYSMTKLKTINPSAKTGFLYADGIIGMADYAVKHGMDALHPALYNLQYDEFVAACKSKGIALNVWTVNEKQYMKMLCKLSVNAMITDYPDIALKVVNEYVK